MRVLVCGGRRFNDALTFGSYMGGLEREGKISCVIQGGASGADYMAKKFAEWRGYPVETYAADWKKHGSAAGPIRNQRMLDEGKPDVVLAMPGGAGTADMVRRASAAGIRVIGVLAPVDVSETAHLVIPAKEAS